MPKLEDLTPAQRRAVLSVPVMVSNGKGGYRKVGTVKDLQKGSPKRASIQRLVDADVRRNIRESEGKRGWPRFVLRVARSYTTEGKKLPAWLAPHVRRARAMLAARARKR